MGAFVWMLAPVGGCALGYFLYLDYCARHEAHDEAKNAPLGEVGKAATHRLKKRHTEECKRRRRARLGRNAGVARTPAADEDLPSESLVSDAVKVVVSAPVVSAPCTAPAAPPSDCISTTSGTRPNTLSRPDAAHASACSPIGLAGVIG